MFGEGVIEGLVTSFLISTAGAIRHPRLIHTVLLPGKRNIRISMSSLLKVHKKDQYLLIRNYNRPEQFGPIGGVNKYYPSAASFLDSICFRPQVINCDMENDLRGFLPVRNLLRFLSWYRRKHDCETVDYCIRRELEEELKEINVTNLPVPQQLIFKQIRQIVEGPFKVPGPGYLQFRIFEILELRTDDPVTSDFADYLWSIANTHNDIVVVSSQEISIGRSKNGSVIGSLSEYLYQTKAIRPEGPSL